MVALADLVIEAHPGLPLDHEGQAVLVGMTAAPGCPAGGGPAFMFSSSPAVAWPLACAALGCPASMACGPVEVQESALPGVQKGLAGLFPGGGEISPFWIVCRLS